MRVQFDQKPSKMPNICRLQKAAASSSLCDFLKTHVIGLIRKSI